MSVNTVIPFVPVNAPFLLYNGSAAYDAGKKELTRYELISVDPETLVNDLQTRFPALNIEIQGLDAHHMIRQDTGWEGYNVQNQCAWAYADPDHIPRPLIKVALYGEFRTNTVAGMYDATEEDLELFRQAIDYVESTYGEKVEVFRACPRIADIHAKGVSKLRSARLLQQELGKKYLVCVGDAENDITMLDGADFAYCPGDAIVKDRYENVCACAEGAVADVIYKKIPAIIANEA